jgi:outer membrane protein
MRTWHRSHELRPPLLFLTVVALSLCHALLASSGEAQTSPGTSAPMLSQPQEPRVVSLEEAWRIALENNLTLGQQDLLLRQSEEELGIQSAGRLPTLSTVGSYSYTSEIAVMEIASPLPGVTLPRIEAGTRNRYDVAAVLDQPIFTGFRTSNQINAARQQLLAQKSRREAVENQILLLVGQLYFQTQENELQRQVVEQAIERADHHLDKVRSFYFAKQAMAFDTLEVANRRLQLKSQLGMLLNQHEVLTSKLGHAMNVQFSPNVVPVPAEGPSLLLDDLGEYLDSAAKERPELMEMVSLEKGALFRMRALRSAYLPQLYATASYHYGRPGANFFEDEWVDYYTVGLNVRWQVWNWLQDQRQVRRARLEHERVALQAEQLKLDVQQQVTEAYQQLKTTREQIELHRQLVNQERERYRITRENYEQANATSLDLSIAENTLTSAELTLKQNYTEWVRNLLQLQFATGRVGEESTPK